MSKEPSLLADLARETAESWIAMTTFGKALVLISVLAFVAFNRFNWPGIPHAALALIRIGSLSGLIVGLYDNARVMDEFYQRVHLLACTFALIVSSLVLYALAEFGINIGPRFVSVIAATWCLGFISSFAFLRRA